MIKRYSDHAANERTFLAWVRTAIAVMAFGFVIERFDLFLHAAAPQLPLLRSTVHGEKFADAAGLAFIGIGVAMVLIAGIRFAVTGKSIDADETVTRSGGRFDMALAALVALLGAALILYMMGAVRQIG